MKKIVIDTNALISFVTDRNPGQQEKVAALMEKAAGAEVALICPQNVVTEFVYVMEKVYSVAKPRIASIVRDFLALPGVEVADEIDFRRLFALWPEHIAEYGDAIVAAVCLSRKGSAVASFDKKLTALLRKNSIPTASF